MSEVRHTRRALTFVTLSLAGVAAGLPILRLRAALHDAHPVGDYAIFEVNVRMALAGVQRLGPYSQGFRHPGAGVFLLVGRSLRALRRHDEPLARRLACVAHGENYFTTYPVCAWWGP